MTNDQVYIGQPPNGDPGFSLLRLYQDVRWRVCGPRSAEVQVNANDIPYFTLAINGTTYYINAQHIRLMVGSTRIVVYAPTYLTNHLRDHPGTSVIFFSSVLAVEFDTWLAGQCEVSPLLVADSAVRG